MNANIPDYSAVYNGPNLDYCTPCQQAQLGPQTQSAAQTSPGYTQTVLPMPLMTPQGGSMMPAGSTQPSQLPSGTQQSTGTAGQQITHSTLPSTMVTGMFAPITDTTQVAPMTADSLEYLNGLMRSQIGRRVKVDFLIGTNTFTDKAGTLVGVGANYILLREANTDDILACDFFNIKFVTFYY